MIVPELSLYEIEKGHYGVKGTVGRYGPFLQPFKPGIEGMHPMTEAEALALIEQWSQGVVAEQHQFSIVADGEDSCQIALSAPADVDQVTVEIWRDGMLLGTEGISAKDGEALMEFATEEAGRYLLVCTAPHYLRYDEIEVIAQ